MTMKGLLFDLDGTLVDTLEDIRAALNHVLGMCYARPIDEAECRAVVGHGLRKALRRGKNHLRATMESHHC